MVSAGYPTHNPLTRGEFTLCTRCGNVLDRDARFSLDGPMPMDSTQIKEHWRGWAKEHGTGIRATSMCETVKMLEIDALDRQLCRIMRGTNAYVRFAYGFRVLEVGCGNGQNLVELAKRFPRLSFYGVDYLPEMVEAAEKNAQKANTLHQMGFYVGDVLNLDKVSEVDQTFDVIISDRLIINLNTVERQREGIQILASRVCRGGHLLLIENSITMRNEQNRLRELLGLPARPPAPFNRFVSEKEIKSHLDSADMELVEIEDFMSLHDLLLYVLIPAMNGGTVDYEHPLVKIATELLLKTNPDMFGSWGQNRLFVCRRRENADV